MREVDRAAVLLVDAGLSAPLRGLLRAACEQIGVRVVEMHDATGALPPLPAEPLLVVAGLPSGSRIVPPQLGALLTRELPGVPLCLFTEETLVRPSVTLNAGQLHLIGAPLGELRVTAWLQALRRARAGDRETTSTSAVGGRIHIVEKRVGALSLATVTHAVADRTNPAPVVDAAIGRSAVLALVPLGQPEAPPLDTVGRPVARDGVVALSVGGQSRALRLSVERADTELRIGSPYRAPQHTMLDAVAADELVLPMEAGDVVVVSWPRGAIDDSLFAPLLLDGLEPTVAALELMNRLRTTDFAAVALEVR